MGRAGRTPRGIATRARIVEVASGRFVADGYLATTIADIARDAGLSAQAVYLAFGSKAAILSAAYDAATVGPDDCPAWPEAIEQQPTAPGVLDVALDFALDGIERTGQIHAVCRAAAADAEVAALLADLGRRRRDFWHERVLALSSRPGVRVGLTVERARDALYTVAGYEPWQALTRECGWSVPEWRDFVRMSARAHVLVPGDAPEARDALPLGIRRSEG